ncbi:MAG: hypothetical protein WAW92_00605 [Minisyncoccia bacterium]
MIKSDKNLKLSIGFLVFSVVSYWILYKVNFNYSFDVGVFEKINDWFLKITKGHWKDSSADIIYYAWLTLPLIFLFLSGLFGVKKLKMDKNLGKNRVIALSIMTLSFTLLVIGFIAHFTSFFITP